MNTSGFVDLTTTSADLWGTQMNCWAVSQFYDSRDVFYFYYRSLCAHAALGGNNFPCAERAEWQQSCHRVTEKYDTTPAEKPLNYTGSEDEETGLVQGKIAHGMPKCVYANTCSVRGGDSDLSSFPTCHNGVRVIGQRYQLSDVTQHSPQGFLSPVHTA